PLLAVPVPIALVVAIVVGAVLSAALGPLVLDRLPPGAPVLVGLIVAAGILDAAVARAITARPVVARPLVDLPTLAGVAPAVVTAVVVGLGVAVTCSALLAGTRWG